jgi:hypothetical protein
MVTERPALGKRSVIRNVDGGWDLQLSATGRSAHWPEKSLFEKFGIESSIDFMLTAGMTVFVERCRYGTRDFAYIVTIPG